MAMDGDLKEEEEEEEEGEREREREWEWEREREGKEGKVEEPVGMALCVWGTAAAEV